MRAQRDAEAAADPTGGSSAPSGARGSVIDSHLHLWDPERMTYPWLAGAPVLDRAFTAVDYPGDPRVGEVVVVEADRLSSQAGAEVAWLGEQSRRGVPVRGIVAHAPLEEGAAVSGRLAALRRRAAVVGVRRLLQGEEDITLGGTLLPGLRAVLEAGLVFDACVTWPQLPALHRVLVEVPELTVVLDHLGKPPVQQGIDSDAGRRWRRSLRALAELPRLRVKLSGLAPESAPGTDLAAAAAPFLGEVLDAVGPARCLLGSDWPVSSLVPEPRPYAEWLDLVLDGSGLDAAGRQSVASRTAIETYALAERDGWLPAD